MNKSISIIKSLDFSLGAVDVRESAKLTALQNHYIREVKNFDVDKIYFSGEFPSVYFKKVADFEEDTLQLILDIHKKVWNQGKVPFLYVESPYEVRVYNCYEKPVKFEQEDRKIDELELYKTALNDLSELKEIFDKVSIETGQFWKAKQYAEKLNTESRVEEELIKNLKKTSSLLMTDLPVEVIHNLLLRSLFILYLEDRQATDPKFYKKITGSNKANSYFDILDSKKKTYLLFEELEDRFNGNLSPITIEEKLLVTKEHLAKIKACFWAEIQKGGQLRLFDWRLFNFEIIPIQLLSEIYENFLEAEDPKGKAKAGAFYTPHPLAEFILNELLPYPSSKDTRYNIKTLDPTCGSGIFLVETLNRLLDRWEMAHPKKELDFDTICKIVKDNIFGIEINPEAIKVAAFSIYLAMLNRLNPKTLWQNKRFPYLIFDPNIKEEEKQGGNLFLMSSLDKEPIEDIELVVGNPPFKRKGRLKEEEQAYLSQRGFAKELLLAFLHRVTVLAPNAKYGLICGSKPVLFNNGKPYQRFRRFLFNENYVEKVFNFSILRKIPKSTGGKNLFSSATSPISIIFYSKQIPDILSEKIMYCAPTTAFKNKIIDGITIDKTDIKYLPRIECQKPDTKIWKIAMWGTERDFELINSLTNEVKIIETIKLKSWEIGGGYQDSKPLKHINLLIKDMPMMESKSLSRYYTHIKNTHAISNERFRRLGNTEVYKAPHLLIKRGQSRKQFCASYLDYDCSFKSIMYGIYAKGSSSELKILSAYFNSNIASYLLFLLSASWGIEREEIISKELLSLPNLCLTFTNKKEKVLVDLVNQIIEIKKSNLVDEINLIEKVEQRIEATIWDALKFSKIEKILIEDFLTFTLDAFQNKQKSIAYHPNRLDENKLYAKYFCQTINEFLDYDDEIKAWATVFDISAKIPLNVIVLYLNNSKKANAIIELPEREIGQILKSMEQHSYKEFSESIYYRRFFRYYNDDKIYIIKPNEKRFWSRSMAINDADEIIAETLNQKAEV